MSYANADRRYQVVRLLEGGTARKLMRGEVERAADSIGDAYHLALHPTPLESPWPEICAYRLAHLLLREKEVDLEEPLRLFAEAARLEALGPWPCLYQLALQVSLGRANPDLWEEAWRRRSGQAAPADTAGAGLRSKEITALELMACCLGNFSRLDRLSGLGLPLGEDDHPIWSHFFSGEECAWRLFGPSHHLSLVVYPKSAARIELAALCQGHPHGFFFILSCERPAYFWHQGDWYQFPKTGLLELLVMALRTRKYDNASLAESLSISDGALRVRKVELHNLLRPRFPEIGEVPPYELEIFGLVQHGAIGLT